jgi:hypothetical protein
MCEFVANHVDMKRMTQAKKKKLRSELLSRKKMLEKRVAALDKAIKKIK